MKTFVLRVTSILFLLAPVCWGYSPSEGNVSVYTGLFLSKTHVSEKTNSPDSPNQLGLGAVVLGDVNKNGSLEIGLFLMDKDYYREENYNYISEETRLIHITMGYRRWLSPYFSASLTFFSAYAMGDVIITQNNIPPGNDVTTSARDATEYGFDFAFQYEVWEHDLNAVVLDLRYSKSVTGKSAEDSDHYGLLIGYRYILQEKKPNVKMK
ncbi:MAG: hypothetical protein K0R29_961 [Pseudobdellovibrio sp.]|nr:hypothetical protein [Pseudobdellovibrio sp.]